MSVTFNGGLCPIIIHLWEIEQKTAPQKKRNFNFPKFIDLSTFLVTNFFFCWMLTDLKSVFFLAALPWNCCSTVLDWFWHTLLPCKVEYLSVPCHLISCRYFLWYLCFHLRERERDIHQFSFFPSWNSKWKEEFPKLQNNFILKKINYTSNKRKYFRK